MFSNTKKSSKTFMSLNPTRNTWFKNISRLLRKERISPDSWDEAIELLVASDISYSTASNLVEEAQEAYEKKADTNFITASDYLKKAIFQHLNNSKSPIKTQKHKDLLVILVVGVNGVGKTTTIAKLAKTYMNDGNSVLLGAGDTFRAAATEQLKILADKIGCEVISQQPGADPAAVAYDSVKAAKARKFDVLIIDTAGRLHTKSNLMEELKKIKRVISDAVSESAIETFLIIDATTGQNGLIQAEAFSNAVDCDGIILTKLDGTAKGGIVISIIDKIHVPVLYIGTGESIDDLSEFDANEFTEALFESNATDNY
tara:strand:- start:17798 stop:18742 length:945 start_codon:yes stop_codon:yes gene_type:complete